LAGWEGFLGLWLLTGIAPRRVWVAVVGTFIALAAAGLHLALTGQQSCGCLGRVTINPWYACLLDAIGLIALWHWRPRLPPFRRRLASMVAGVASAAIVVSGICAFAYWEYGSLRAGLVAATQGGIWVEPAGIDLGPQPARQRVPFRLSIVNGSDRRVQLVGFSASCTCSSTPTLGLELPADIEPETRLELPFTVTAGAPGQATHYGLGLLVNDAGELRRFRVDIQGGQQQ
jgi:hypothetical protein